MFSIYIPLNITVHPSNPVIPVISRNIIIIVMREKITDYTGKYPETLFILLNNRNFPGVTMNCSSLFFPM